MSELLTIGVEEEFFVIDPRNRRPVNDITALLESAHGISDGSDSYSAELRTCMVESKTGVCRTLTEVRDQVGRLRSGLARAAAETGTRIAAAGTFPLADWRHQDFDTQPRTKFIVDRYARMARTHVMCACQVHVGVADPDTRIQVMNRVRPWLPLLSALSASSPFWMGEDTGYASYRSTVWQSWPMGGIPPTFGSDKEYRERMRTLVATDIIADIGQIYWDVRPGTNYDTVEFRPADACTTVDDTVLQAALCRALVLHALGELDRGAQALDVRDEVLRAAKWRAARYGLAADLLDPLAAELVPAGALIDRMLRMLRPALEDVGDWDEVIHLIDRKKVDGTSAERQRAIVTGGGTVEDVADLLVRQTVSHQQGGVRVDE
ncbi:carboxylate-amine ligase [Nocardia iowensis]|uniref:Putative glutamate--cysteine ligase 2 n=1 Tax=Nocardia iowensis TaxID=204891 RepID=A0ABX8RU08_NOCIO|nr:glutamate--cysteine ligase [Nocardia iowensis]QXN93128.1 glutamate--cysteine ligase [Nocardia iowensis]